MWHSFIMLCPISWPDSTQMTQTRGTVWLCPVWHYLSSQKGWLWTILKSYKSLHQLGWSYCCSAVVEEHRTTHSMSNHKVVCIYFRGQCSCGTIQKHYPACHLSAIQPDVLKWQLHCFSRLCKKLSHLQPQAQVLQVVAVLCSGVLQPSIWWWGFTGMNKKVQQAILLLSSSQESHELYTE